MYIFTKMHSRPAKPKATAVAEPPAPYEPPPGGWLYLLRNDPAPPPPPPCVPPVFPPAASRPDKGWMSPASKAHTVLILIY